MAYSVVGYDFYIGRRNWDGTDVNPGDNTILGVNNDTTTEGDSYDGTKFTQHQATWFGMSGCNRVLQGSKSTTCATKMCSCTKNYILYPS